MGMRVDIVTLFPEMCQQVLDASIIGRAAKRGYIETHCHQIRDYTLNKQKQTDDYPYGGGCGMVLYAQPIADCLRAVQKEVAEQGRPAPHIVFLTAGGQRYTEEHARRLAEYDNLTLVCGHYEGIDERVIDAFADEEISIGDYILTGGELASLVVADSVLRLKPGVLAEQKGYEEESYWDGLLEYPQYTRPEVWEGRAVPDVLLGGDHRRSTHGGAKRAGSAPVCAARSCMNSGVRPTPSLSCPSGNGAKTSASSGRRNSIRRRRSSFVRDAAPSAPGTGRQSIVRVCGRKPSSPSSRQRKKRAGPAISIPRRMCRTVW